MPASSKSLIFALLLLFALGSSRLDASEIVVNEQLLLYFRRHLFV